MTAFQNASGSIITVSAGYIFFFHCHSDFATATFLFSASLRISDLPLKTGLISTLGLSIGSRDTCRAKRAKTGISL